MEEEEEEEEKELEEEEEEEERGTVLCVQACVYETFYFKLGMRINTTDVYNVSSE